MTASAGFVVIGDEILSGKTKDKNIGALAERLSLAGIDLCEVRIVADDEAAIISAVNALRERYSYVFTSGGIGPTHDDITAQSIAAAFSVDFGVNQEAFDLLASWYKETGRKMNDARKRMTMMPVGAKLVENPVSKAPGFQLENVFVFAGVPSIFEAMLDAVLPTLEGGVPIFVETIGFPCGEGDIGTELAKIAEAHGGVSIGSYPKMVDGAFLTDIVLRSRDRQALDAAVAAAQELRSQVDGLLPSA
ncbi:MAG: molybdopterin-binding protein [Pseudomonadota bacterium]